MNYIGSKVKLSKFIINAIKDTVGKTKSKSFAELFGGTGIVARLLKTSFKEILVNDLEYYSYVLLRNYIGNNKRLIATDLISELNSLKGTQGKIFEHYCKGGRNGRNYFTDENGMKIDAIREKIEEKKKKQYINDDEYFFALASLLESADKVANTASVYGAYLKHTKRTAQKRLILEPAVFEITKNKTKVYNEDANSLIKKLKGDVLYLDPPYNHRQYGANYHLLNTIALYDDFQPKGKSGLRNYERSKYCIKSEASKEFEQLLSDAQFKYIFVSYNNEGIIDLKKIRKILSKYGEYNLLQFDGYQRFKADKDKNRKYKASKTTEYLHVLIKSD